MSAVACLSIGYVCGSVNPASMLAKWKGADLQEGTGNPGATNTMLVMGFRYGLLVLIFDMMKTLFARRVARVLFPHLYYAGLLAACGAVIGHIFPLFMEFHGGKGVACFAALVMSYDFGLFLVMLALGITVMFTLNYGVLAPITVAVVFPLMVLWQTGSVWLWVMTGATGLLLIYRHAENLQNIKDGTEIKVRSYFGERLRKYFGCGEHKK